MSETMAAVTAAVLYLGAAGLVFVFGSSYYALFRTNRSWLFRIGLVALFAVSTWLVRCSRLDTVYASLASSFLAASVANVLGAAAAQWLRRPLELKNDSIRGIGLAKGLEALAVVTGILLLAVALRIPLGDLYLKAGHLGLGIGIGAGGFLLFAIIASRQARQMRIPARTIARLAPWMLLFIFSNGFMEELWFRALFLRPMVSLVGPIAAIGLTSVVFAFVHVGATYLSKEERARFLFVILFLGLAWGTCTYFLDSLIAATAFHAGADLMVLNGFIAARHERTRGEDRSVAAEQAS
jgi:membrane protease YdiL (CAAX protease family)